MVTAAAPKSWFESWLTNDAAAPEGSTDGWPTLEKVVDVNFPLSKVPSPLSVTVRMPPRSSVPSVEKFW